IFALTSALAAACFVKAFGITFLALPRSEGAKNAKESSKFMLSGTLMLSILCVVLGVCSQQIFNIMGYSFQLPNMLFIGVILAGFYLLSWATLRALTKNKIRITKTWGCGFTSQSSKMEYTASGFSEPIVTIMKSIFRTKKESEYEFYDKKRAIFKKGKAEIHLLKFFEEYLYLPIANFVNKISSQVNDIQRGDVDLHVGYAFVAVVVLLLLVWWFA
ncbi:MAG: hydrogenase membrane subunit, partial [Crenarchaeota archaeon]|nr:hydrogenase membrane subunit [Thermoproteota archaeon]